MYQADANYRHLTLSLDYCTMYDGFDSDVISAKAQNCVLKRLPDSCSMSFTAEISGAPALVLIWLLNSGFCTSYGEFCPSLFEEVLATASYSK